MTSYNPNDDDKPRVDEVYSIAGSYATSTGKGLDPKFERLEDIPDSDMTGLRLELHGGTYKKENQMAIIDLQCDPERTGNEKSPVKKGNEEPEGKSRSAESDDKDDTEDGDDDDDDNSLRFVSYEKEDDKQILRLDWRTKYACEKFEEDDDEDSGKDGGSKHWGFFTWFIVVYVLLTINLPTWDSLLTCLPLQPLPGYSRLPNLRVVAQLQSVRCARLGSPSTWRHNQRRSILIQRLVEKSG
jgi:Autophagy-related protein 27